MERANTKILGNDATTFAACFYNEKKVAEGKAIFLGMKNFGELEEYNIHSPVVVSRYLKKIADRNPQVVHPQKHMMFSLPGKPTEEDKQRLLEHAIKVLEELGYKGQPMIFWGHIDSGHYHIHSATVTVNQTTGEWIDNYCEGIKARRILDKLLGYNKKDKLENLLKYKFESREQFLNLLRAVGYRQSYYNSELGVVHVRRAQEVLTNFTDEEINNQIEATGKNKDNEKDRIKQLKGIILDHRRRSMDYLVDDSEVVKTKKGKKHTATDSKKGVKGAAFDGQNALGDDIKGIRKAQFKQYLEELKENFGLSVVFSKWDGEVKGYTIVDNNKKIVFKGSDIMPLEQLLNPDWRKGQEKGTILSSDEAANTVEIIQNEKMPEDDMLYLDEEQFDPSTLQPHELPVYIIEECDRNYISTKGIYTPNLDDIEMTAEEARKEAFYLLEKAKYENDNGNRLEAEKTADAAVAYANYAWKGKKIVKPAPVTKKPETKKSENRQNQTDIRRYFNCRIDVNNKAVIITDRVDVDELYGIGKKMGGKIGATSNGLIMFTFDTVQEGYRFADTMEELAKARATGDYLNEKAILDRIYPVNSQMSANTEMADNFPFVNIQPEVFIDDNNQYCIKVFIDGEEYEAKRLKDQHLQWYLNTDNKNEVAMKLGFHYYADEIEKVQINNWKEKHFEVGEMPFGITIEKTYGHTDNQGERFWVNGDFYEDGNKLDTTPKEISREEWLKFNNSDAEEAKKIVCRSVGRKLVEASGFPPASERIYDKFDTPSSFDSLKAVEETLLTMGELTSQLCNEFIEACGDIAEVYLSAFDAVGISGAGGGQSTGDLRGKDDDDKNRRHQGIMDNQPKKRRR